MSSKRNRDFVIYRSEVINLQRAEVNKFDRNSHPVFGHSLRFVVFEKQIQYNNISVNMYLQ